MSNSNRFFHRQIKVDIIKIGFIDRVTKIAAPWFNKMRFIGTPYKANSTNIV